MDENTDASAAAVAQDARIPASAPEPPAETAPQGAPNALSEAIERWWADHFPGSAVARDTQAWNVAHRAKDDLKRRLAALR